MLSEVDDTKVFEFAFIITTNRSQIIGIWKTESLALRTEHK